MAALTARGRGTTTPTCHICRQQVKPETQVVLSIGLHNESIGQNHRELNEKYERMEAEIATKDALIAAKDSQIADKDTVMDEMYSQLERKDRDMTKVLAENTQLRATVQEGERKLEEKE